MNNYHMNKEQWLLCKWSSFRHFWNNENLHLAATLNGYDELSFWAVCKKEKSRLRINSHNVKLNTIRLAVMIHETLWLYAPEMWDAYTEFLYSH